MPLSKCYIQPSAGPHILRGTCQPSSRGSCSATKASEVSRLLGAASHKPPHWRPGPNLLHRFMRGVHLVSSGIHSHCASGGWALGNVIDGTQPKYVRIPHAASSLHKLPTNIDAQAAVAFSGTLPKGHEYGTINANVQTEARSPLSEQAPLACQ